MPYSEVFRTAKSIKNMVKKNHIRNNFALTLYPILLIISIVFQLFLHLRMPLAIFSQCEVYVKKG